MKQTDLTFNVDLEALERSRICAGLCPDHVALLRQTNGLYAYGCAIHVFGVGDSVPEFHDLERWNDESRWRREYGELASGMIFF